MQADQEGKSLNRRQADRIYQQWQKSTAYQEWQAYKLAIREHDRNKAEQERLLDEQDQKKAIEAFEEKAGEIDRILTGAIHGLTILAFLFMVVFVYCTLY